MEKLRILIITQGEWTPKFGAIKVHIEIKEEYERQGHEVDKISWEDLYPKGQSLISKVFGQLYTEHIFTFLKKNAHKYDVIDANFSCVIYPKESFGFKGLLLFRSHGIDPVYKWAEKNIIRYKKALEEDARKITLKTSIGNIYRALQKNAGVREFELSVKYADIVHCLNKAEFEYFKEQGVPDKKLLLLPNGIQDDFIHEMNSKSSGSRKNKLCFVGAWNVRKGIKDMDEIISLVEKVVRLNEIVLLGGQYSEKTIRSFFSEVNLRKLNVIPDFDKAELFGYVKECKVGLFPSYIEGHPLAIIEQLSMGIPVVAYNVPGSADILEKLDPSFLVSPGDIVAFSNKVSEVFNLDIHEYQVLSEKCKIISR